MPTSNSAPDLVAPGRPVYARIPRPLLRDTSISRDARLLWAILEDHTSKDSQVPWPSQSTLAQYMGCTERAVRNWLNELVKAGWLEVHSRPGSSNLHVLRWEGPRNGGSALPRNGGSYPPGTVVPPKKNQEEEPVEVIPPTPLSDNQPSLLEGAPPNPPEGGIKKRQAKRQTQTQQLDASFEQWWPSYPSGKSKGKKNAALRAWRNVIAKGKDKHGDPIDTNLLTQRANNYVNARHLYTQHWKDRGEPNPQPPLMNASTFINGRSADWAKPWTEDDIDFWPAPSGREWGDGLSLSGFGLQDALDAEIAAERAAREQAQEEAA